MEEIRSIKVKTNNLNEMISMIKKGLPAETVVTLSTSLDMSIKATAELTNIAESTLARRRREKGKLRASESDRVHLDRWHQQLLGKEPGVPASLVESGCPCYHRREGRTERVRVGSVSWSQPGSGLDGQLTPSNTARIIRSLHASRQMTE